MIIINYKHCNIIIQFFYQMIYIIIHIIKINNDSIATTLLKPVSLDIVEYFRALNQSQYHNNVSIHKTVDHHILL